MEAEKTKKARKPRKQPKVHVEVVGSWKDRPAYEQFQHWKPHIENMYHMLGYGDVTVEPSQEMIDEYNAIQANKKKELNAPKIGQAHRQTRAVRVLSVK